MCRIQRPKKASFPLQMLPHFLLSYSIFRLCRRPRDSCRHADVIFAGVPRQGDHTAQTCRFFFFFPKRTIWSAAAVDKPSAGTSLTWWTSVPGSSGDQRCVLGWAVLG